MSVLVAAASEMKEAMEATIKSPRKHESLVIHVNSHQHVENSNRSRNETPAGGELRNSQKGESAAACP
jgi:hypothetical protein